MEDLAFIALLTLESIYGVSVIAFALSWVRNRAARITTEVCAALGIISSTLIGFTLRDGNGLLIAATPALLSIIAVWNTIRVNRTHK